MKRYALMLLAAMALLVGAGYFLWLVLHAIYSLFSDWWLYRELDELEQIGQQRRQMRRADAQQRLATGCDHDFDDPTGVLPPATCIHCGMEKERPPGDCDHLWVVRQQPFPRAVCQKCGRQYRPEQEK